MLNLDRSTLSSVSLTLCVHYACSKGITLRRMPPDGYRKRVEQLGLGFQLHVREDDVPTLDMVVGSGTAGERRDD